MLPAVTAVAAPVRVSVLLPLPGDAMLAGENTAVTPFGNPVIARATAALKPFCPSVVNVRVAGVPAVSVLAVALGVRVNEGTATVKLMACVLVSPPPVAVTVTVVLPAVTAPAAPVKVNMLLPLPGDAMLAGENAAVTPFGNPVTVRATAALKLLCPAVVKVRVAGVPAVSVLEVALGVSVKLGVVTVSAIVAVCATPPLVPVIVMVELPAAAPLLAEIVAVTPAVAVSVDEENEIVTPVGAPLAESVTGELKPFAAANVSLTVFDDPVPTVKLEDAAVTPNVALASPQWLTNRLALIDPSPVAWSYPVPAVKPVTPGTLLLPLVVS